MSNVLEVVIKAKNCFGGVVLSSKSAPQFMIQAPGKAAVGDELGQKGFASVKWYDAFARLNESWILRLEVAATQSPA
jgi:N4-gp56 family major capsid protein